MFSTREQHAMVELARHTLKDLDVLQTSVSSEPPTGGSGGRL